MKYRVSLCLFIIGCLCVSCVGLNRTVDKDPFHLKHYKASASEQEETRRLIGSIRQKNADLQTVKGIGNIRLWDKNESISSRMAWIGDTQNKLRIEMLSVYGQPTSSITSDGTWFYFYSHLEDRYLKKRLNDNVLESFFSLPLSFNTIEKLFVGRIPLGAYQSARLIENPANDGYILLILLKTAGRVEKIHLNRDKTHISTIEQYEPDGSLVYRIMFANDRNIQSYTFPFNISVLDDKGAGIQIDIDRCWVNMPVDPSVFVLPRPG